MVVMKVPEDSVKYNAFTTFFSTHRFHPNVFLNLLHFIKGGAELVARVIGTSTTFLKNFKKIAPALHCTWLKFQRSLQEFSYHSNLLNAPCTIILVLVASCVFRLGFAFYC